MGRCGSQVVKGARVSIKKTGSNPYIGKMYVLQKGVKPYSLLSFRTKRDGITGRVEPPYVRMFRENDTPILHKIAINEFVN